MRSIFEGAEIPVGVIFTVTLQDALCPPDEAVITAFPFARALIFPVLSTAAIPGAEDVHWTGSVESDGSTLTDKATDAPFSIVMDAGETSTDCVWALPLIVTAVLKEDTAPLSYTTLVLISYVPVFTP